MTLIRLRPPFLSITLASILSSTPALAQEMSGTASERARQSSDRTIVGLGMAVVPVYQGADDYRVLPLPAVDIVSGPFFANFRNGIGVNVVDTPNFTFGGSVTFMPGYRRKDVPVGVGRLSAGAGGRLFVSTKAGGVIATLGGTQGFVGSTRGFIADASLSYPMVMSPRLVLIPSIATTWADRKHNDRYFGIGTQQSLASGLPAYEAGSGFKDASALLTASYRLSSRINLSASGGVTTLLGDAEDSPLVVHRTRPTGFLSMSYRLGN